MNKKLIEYAQTEYLDRIAESRVANALLNNQESTMGYSITSIPFFTDDITITPHSASKAEHLGKALSIREFCNGHPCRLLLNEDTGEYTFELLDKTFATGPEK